MTDKDSITNLTDGNNQNANTNASIFVYKQVKKLCKELRCPPLPTDGYYYRSDRVVNHFSLESVPKAHYMCMDTDIDHVFYVFNKDR